jgi:RNA polymerase sigma-70 factor (ECF subfamily)
MAYPLSEILFSASSPDGDGGHAARRWEHEAPDTPVLSNDDLGLVQSIRDGNAQAFERLFHTHYQGVVTYLTRTVGAAWDAEELTQSVFVRLWERRAEFEPRTSVRSYLYGAARHAALNLFREGRRPAIPDDAGRSTTMETADVALEQHELEAAVQHAIDALPERAREVWMLHRDHEMTVGEVAALLKISPNTVKTHLARTLATLRRVVAPFLQT